MIIAPTLGPVGLQPAGVTTKMINRHGSAVAIGDLVISSFAHTNVAFSTAPADDAALRLSPLSCVKLADGDASVATAGAGDHSQAGYLGVVVGLGNQNGATGTEIDVQFGGVVQATVIADSSTAVTIGSKLYASDTAGRLSQAGGSTAPDLTVAISLGALTANTTGLINVLLCWNGPVDITTQ